MSKVIAFEGLDFAGKSTMIEDIKERMAKDGLEMPVQYAEPRKDSEEWKALRKMVISPTMPKVAQIYCSVAGRVSLFQDHIIPDLAAGNTVFEDRCVLTSMVYQQDQNHNEHDILLINVSASRYLPRSVVPDVVVFLDITYNTYMERLGVGRDEVEAIETYLSNPDNFNRFRKGYHDALKAMQLACSTKVIITTVPNLAYEQLKPYLV